MGDLRQRWWALGRDSALRLASDEREVDDVALAEALSHGHEWAAITLWDRYAPMVYRLLDRTLGASGESEDLTQDVFLGVYAGIGALRDRSALRSFVYSVAVRKLRWHLRKRRVRRLLVLSDHGELPELPAYPVDSEGRRALTRFYQLLDSLSANDRTAYVMRQIEKMRLEEIADATGVSLATVKRRVSRASLQITRLAQLDPELAYYLSPLGGRDET